MQSVGIESQLKSPGDKQPMHGLYPERIRQLPAYGGRFDAHRLVAEGAEVLLASYPAGIEKPGTGSAA
jgi:hypothetical protein